MKALVLSSGGIDSTTCIAIAVKALGKENVATLSMFYGQKHAKELTAAADVAEYYGIPNYQIDLSELYKFTNNPLLMGSSESIPHKSYAEQIIETGKVITYVPFRNGLFLSVAAVVAESLFPNEECHIYIGAHADDATGNAYADCSKSFTTHMEYAVRIGTYGKKELIAPLIALNKSDVVEVGLKLKAPYHLTWSCYEGGEEPCGRCATCIDRRKAFEANGYITLN